MLGWHPSPSPVIPVGRGIIPQRLGEGIEPRVDRFTALTSSQIEGFPRKNCHEILLVYTTISIRLVILFVSRIKKVRPLCATNYGKIIKEHRDDDQSTFGFQAESASKLLADPTAREDTWREKKKHPVRRIQKRDQMQYKLLPRKIAKIERSKPYGDASRDKTVAERRYN